MINIPRGVRRNWEDIKTAARRKVTCLRGQFPPWLQKAGYSLLYPLCGSGQTTSMTQKHQGWDMALGPSLLALLWALRFNLWKSFQWSCVFSCKGDNSQVLQIPGDVLLPVKATRWPVGKGFPPGHNSPQILLGPQGRPFVLSLSLWPCGLHSAWLDSLTRSLPALTVSGLPSVNPAARSPLLPPHPCLFKRHKEEKAASELSDQMSWFLNSSGLRLYTIFLCNRNEDVVLR